MNSASVSGRLERKRAFPEPARTLFPPEQEDEEDDAVPQGRHVIPLQRSPAAPSVTLSAMTAPDVTDGVAPSEPMIKQKRKASSSSEPRPKKKTPQGPSPWALFLKKFQESNPSMSMGESTVEARKRYTGPNGRPKSYEKTFKQVWQHRNPTWKLFGSPEEIKARMREDFLNKI